MIDTDGFRLNVGIILVNQEGHLFWAKRVGMNAWQFPQGGIKEAETPEQALFRELSEEIGLENSDVEIMGCTSSWLKYRLPKKFIRSYSKPLCVGQKQKWFMLRLLTSDTRVSLNQCEVPEFEAWRWIRYWRPLSEVIAFKRDVYRRALHEFAPLIYPINQQILNEKVY